MEAKKQGEEDLSMEEILQSIRKIIAEEGDETKPADTTVASATGGDSASDILELTEIIDDDKQPGDVLNDIDAALTPEPTQSVEEQIPTETPKPIEIIAEDKAEQHITNAFDVDALLSETARTSAMQSLDKIKAIDVPPPLHTTNPPIFRSGKTVEDMVAEMLHPMMKEWLDKNLPSIVERIVEREVKRLTRK